jgi:hypothetical protein
MAPARVGSNTWVIFPRVWPHANGRTSGDAPRGYWLPHLGSKISYAGKMDWGEACALFGLAFFWAVVLFMVLREPNA